MKTLLASLVMASVASTTFAIPQRHQQPILGEAQSASVVQARLTVGRTLSDNRFDYKPSSDQVAEDGFDYTPQAEQFAEDGFDHTPQAEQFADDGFDHTPLGQLLAEDGSDRTGLGSV